MTLQSSGLIKLSQIQSEFGGSDPISLTEYYGVAQSVPTSGVIRTQDFYGKARFSADIFMDNVVDATYRNYLETKAIIGTGKRTYTGTGAFNEGDPSITRYNSSPSATFDWGAIPANWAYAQGSTLVFANQATSPGAVTATLNGNSLSLTDHGTNGITQSNVRFFTHSSSSTTYNLNNASIYASFSKDTGNIHNSQTTFGFPGNWSVVREGALGTHSCNYGDVVIVYTGGIEDDYITHSVTSSGVTLRNGIRRTRWYDNHNVRLFTADATGSYTITSPSYGGTLIQLRYVG